MLTGQPALVVMAASSAAPISAPVLSHKQRRAALRKERRKRKRQALASARDCELDNGDDEEEEEVIVEDGEDNNVAAEEERQRLHEVWLERERLAQEEFRLRSEREEAARKKKDEEERMIKEEWESQQRREKEEKEQRQQEKRDREEAVQKMLDEAENQLENGGPWMNPEAPVSVNAENFGTERDVANCPFFLKTGACRFGERCSRKHVHPTASPTLMVRGMFRTFGMEELRRDDYDMDACLEHSEEELQESFLEFYHDVLPEFKNVGRVIQFKVCCNYEPHLRGNVYIQFETEELCKEALIKFNGRWYAGRQLHCEICPVTRWKNAICGLFDRRKCPKGKHCNFLHVFRNPGNEFWEADRDLCVSPDRSVRGSRRAGWHSERYRDRSWRQCRYSRSPERRSERRSERSHSRREEKRKRSQSRESRDSHQHRGDSRSSRARYSDSRTDGRRSRSKERSRSRSRAVAQHSLGSRDKDWEHKTRNRSEERDDTDEDEDTRREGREKSRSTSREKKRIKRSREKSPKKSDKSKKMSTDDTNTHRRHKHSKKSKKSRKKHKKKSHVPDVSSGESEEEPVDSPSAQSPREDLKNTDMTQEKCVENDLSPEGKREQASVEITSELTANGETQLS
ncbi:U2 small nuclear ribonucleoprotein auxiliary factor 35 kDa subunit-related protein 2 [Leuresthes tenuis]|uniref:U2 small nuclear ribonucleoprotein auxiliary factor 35 kDa subunit-related protein 2 n=1 Tax=Leuresthes tenuis TaxID=355514 RepID=UPI003B5097CD